MVPRTGSAAIPKAFGLEAGAPKRDPSRLGTPATLFVLATLLAIAPNVWAQSRTPHIGYVYPAGGRQGDTFQIEIGGQYLDGASNVYVSGGGVRATVIEHIKPLAGQLSNELRLRTRELQKKGTDAAGFKEMAEIQKKIRRQLQPECLPRALGDGHLPRSRSLPNAEPGERELRLQVAAGLSNPLVFCVGQLPEFREKDWKSSPADANLTVTLPAGINGRIVPGSFERYRPLVRRTQPYLPGDVDRYRFAARKGQQLVVAVQARELMPYLADAVPGWFQATVTLYDAQGKELAYDDDYRFHPDPVLHYEVPEDGEYVIEIKDAIYRGREDFVYRITVGELPFVTSIFPLGGRAGEQATHRAERLESPDQQADDGRQRQEAGGLSAFRACEEPGLQPRAFRGGHAAGMPRKGAEQRAQERPEGDASHDRQWAYRSAGRLGRFPLHRPCRRSDRRGGQCPPARFAAGFRAQADRRPGPATGLQRRSRRQGIGAEHASRRFPADRHAAGGRDLLSAPGRYSAEGRRGVCLPPADQPAAARFRPAGRAVRHQRRGRQGRLASPSMPCGRMASPATSPWL